MSLFSPYYIGTILNLFSLLVVAAIGSFFALKTKSIRKAPSEELGAFLVCSVNNISAQWMVILRFTLTFFAGVKTGYLTRIPI